MCSQGAALTAADLELVGRITCGQPAPQRRWSEVAAFATDVPQLPAVNSVAVSANVLAAVVPALHDMKWRNP